MAKLANNKTAGEISFEINLETTDLDVAIAKTAHLSFLLSEVNNKMKELAALLYGEENEDED